MKRGLSIAVAVVLACVFVGIAAFARPPAAGRASPGPAAGTGSGRTAQPRAARVASTPQPAAAAPAQHAPPAGPVVIGDYMGCMDAICISPLNPDKGRCRCSAQLIRIERVLRDIERAQAEADRKSVELEGLMNVGNIGAVQGAMGSVQRNIDAIERAARTVAANRIDPNTLVAEGQPLYNEAHRQCQPLIAALDRTDFDAMVARYVSFIEADCAAYTTILNERAQAVNSLLIQAQRNIESFMELRHRERNALDLPACRLEFEACIRNECGLHFRECRQPHQQRATLQRCEDANRGKCDDVAAIIIAGLQDFMQAEIRRDDVAQACTAANGWIERGRCVFKVVFDQGGGDIRQIEVLPGASIQSGGFLLSPGGTRAPAGSRAPRPNGWGTDGFPQDHGLRGTF